ncbi:SulP family inorganic anion transporter [Corynebacterium anserum]|uniref:STAS domain-containing protein n=1 Tax=Corynebacterium anserum TaxID=2684406 RepID=A0A7G7YQ82_9CORY|nr:SulP family inorganic anion transporter [Corynebacterium anserum]MBC2682325.1 STAS domain-containing protein [Corynebacterium anserum]QNH96652.1 STAS domain-containing protein [Corynebacterium anserum]
MSYAQNPARENQRAPTRVWASFRYALSSPARLRTEVLGGLVVALALIPEAISFSVLAGVDPRMGLFASVTMAITIAFTGGRPAMISAATGAVAVVIAPLVASYGTDYLISCILLAGVFQILLALAGVAKLMRFIPRSVMVGFINSLAIIVFSGQIPHLIGVPWLVYPLVAVGILIVIYFPRLTSVIPSPLIAIAVLTPVVILMHWDIPNVADQGKLPDALPSPMLPDVPLTVHTLQIIAPYALAVALVGLMESLLTAKLVDDITDVHSDKTHEGWGQGCANIVTALFGGMGGCAMIGQTLINTRESGARTRLSTLLAGVFLLILVVSLGDIVGLIPMAALTAVMIMVAVNSFDWHSVSPSTLKRMPLSENLVMFITIAGTLFTHNLAIGVTIGVLSAMVVFARRVSHLVYVEDVSASELPESERRHTKKYRVSGQLFFASSNDLVYAFDYSTDPENIIIDLSDAEIWDASTVATLDAITQKYADRNKTVTISGVEGRSKQRFDRLHGHFPSD